jgi:hypothetical protein
MKFSCLPVSLYADITPRRTLADWFPFAAELGWWGDMTSLTFQSRQRGSHALVARPPRRRQIPVMVTYTDFTHPDVEVRKCNRSSLRYDHDAAARMGYPICESPPGRRTRVNREDGIKWRWKLSSCLDPPTRWVCPTYENHTSLRMDHYDF